MEYEVTSYVDEFTSKFLIQKNVTLHVGDVIKVCPKISSENYSKSVPLYTFNGDAFLGFVPRNRLNRDVYNWISYNRYVEVKVLEIIYKGLEINKVIISVFFKRLGYTEKTNIAGLKFYISNFKSTIIDIGDGLVFLRELNNNYDNHAVAIYLENKESIGILGYLPRGTNSFFWEYMKDDGRVEGFIEKLIVDENLGEISNINIKVTCC